MALLKKEKVKNYLGEEVEIEIHYLGGRKRDQLLDEFIQTKFKADSDKKEADVDYKPYTLRGKVMSDFVKGIDVDEISDEDYLRIFETYYQKSFKEVFGDGEEDLKNSN